MRTLSIQILDEASARQVIRQRFKQAKQGEYQGEYLSFESPTALFRAITPKRWELISKLQALGTVSQRELARQLKRDVHRIHDDIKALKNLGLVEQNHNGVFVPFTTIHTDFTLSSEAA